MPNNWFQFKQFTVRQEHAAMKVGTDGVVLGAWAGVPAAGSRVLDVGTGTGLIALMMAQRSRDVWIDAVEIDVSSAKQARENFIESPWKDRLCCVHSSFQEYDPGARKYDQIVCNPPFFSASLKTASPEKNLARHDDSLSLETFFECALPLLSESASISLILPADKENRCMELASSCDLHCRRFCQVFPAPGKPSKRIMMEFSLIPGSCRRESLGIETGVRHHYTEDFKSLVDAFYLHL